MHAEQFFKLKFDIRCIAHNIYYYINLNKHINLIKIYITLIDSVPSGYLLPIHIVRQEPVFDLGRGGVHQNGRGRVFPVILARQEPQRYISEILVVEGQVIPQMKAHI